MGKAQTMALRIGAQLHPQHCSFDELIAAAKTVEAMGVDTLFTWDHFKPLYGVPDAPFGPSFGPDTEEHPRRGAHFEGWTVLTALACHTRRVELGILVTCNSYRNPNLLADIARTVDHASRGRVILGVGSGWYEQEYLDYGYEFGTAASRLQDLGRNLPIIKERLATLNPPPVRSPMPIMIGGGGEKVTLRLTAQYADIWNGFGNAEMLAHKNRVLDDWCAKFGRDPKEIERSTLLMAPNELDELDAMYEAGITHFILGMGTPFAPELLQRLLDWRQARGLTS